jgi:hypothetical protein
MNKKIKFILDINDIKNSNLTSIFGHAGINYNKALVKIEETIKLNNYKTGLYNFICEYNSITKDFNIIVKNINFSFILKQFLFFLFLKNKNYFKNMEKDEKLWNDSLLILNFNFLKNDNNFYSNNKNVYIFYLYFLKFYKKFNSEHMNFNKKSFHFLNLIYLKLILNKLNLKNEMIFY